MLNNIVDNIEQCGQHNILFKAVFINPEQVVRFYVCSGEGLLHACISSLCT